MQAVRAWLILCCALVFGMMVFGAAVRLTGSGLSMVNWQLLQGAIPPLTESQWLQKFAQYQQFPEFQTRNPTMDLRGFKFIFWMEYAHRLLGRVIGLVFLLPLAFFHLRGAFTTPLARRLWVLFMLGACQGLLGWYMVQSGLVGAPQVSQYRLAAHFILAVIIYAGLIGCAISVLPPARPPVSRRVKTSGRIAVGALLLMLASGAFVAGTRAGHIYNTWPRMGDAFLPPQLFALQPFWRNLFENPVAIQFIHRWLAVAVAVAVAAFAVQLIRARQIYSGIILLALLGLQIGLGIAVLLWKVPPPAGVAHQAVALLLFAAAIIPLARANPMRGASNPMAYRSHRARG